MNPPGITNDPESLRQEERTMQVVNGLVKVSITPRQECAGLAYYMYLPYAANARYAYFPSSSVVHKHTTRTNLSAFYGSNGQTRRPHRYSGVISKQWRDLAQGVHVSASR